MNRPVSEWDEMFLPARVAAKLDQLTTERGAPLRTAPASLFRSSAPPSSGGRAPISLGLVALGLRDQLERWGR